MNQSDWKLTNTQILMFIVGWQGGTIHQLAEHLGVPQDNILNADYNMMQELMRLAQTRSIHRDALEQMRSQLQIKESNLQPLLDENAVLRKAKDGAYAERNKLVALLSKIFHSWLGRHEYDPSWDPEWTTIVFIELPTGQASWHIHDSDRNALFSHLPYAYGGGFDWDGHTTEEKYERVANVNYKDVDLGDLRDQLTLLKFDLSVHKKALELAAKDFQEAEILGGGWIPKAIEAMAMETIK